MMKNYTIKAIKKNVKTSLIFFEAETHIKTNPQTAAIIIGKALVTKLA